MEFWDKVSRCQHKNINPSYDDSWSCWTPYCDATESRCLDCGVYISTCGCGFERGLYGWPRSRRRTEERRQDLKHLSKKGNSE